jgi:integrase
MKAATIRQTVRRGALYINVREYHDGPKGTIRYGFDYKPDDYTREKIRRNALPDAISKAEELLGVGHAGKASLLSINPNELAEFLRWKESQRKSPTVPEIVSAFMDEKRALQAKRELSEKHVRDLWGTLKEFAKAFTQRLDELERMPVETWLNDQQTGPRRFNNLRTHLVALVHFARAHNWITTEVTSIEQIPRRKVTTKKETYTPEELKRILQSVPTEWLPAIVFGAFCGVRPEEICPDPKSHKPPLRWENVMWTKLKVEVPADVSKDGRRRWTPICDAAMAFISRWRQSKGRMVPDLRMSDFTAKWATKAQLPQKKWKYDALRHSYASYRLAITNDIAALSLEMGNSVKMIHDHYLDLQHEDVAQEWFGLTPEKCGLTLVPDNVVQFA